MRRLTPGRRAMTLVELIVAIALGIMLVIFLYGFFRFQSGIAIHQGRANDSYHQSRFVLGTLREYATLAGYDPLMANAREPLFGVIAYDERTIQLSFDENEDGELQPEEVVLLEIEPPELRETRAGRTTRLATNLHAGRFRYWLAAETDGRDNDEDGAVDEAGELREAEEDESTGGLALREWGVELTLKGERLPFERPAREDGAEDEVGATDGDGEVPELDEEIEQVKIETRLRLHNAMHVVRGRALP